MKERKLKVLTEYYFGLPYLFGFWISDPEQIRLREEVTKEKWLPRGWLFMGDHHLIQLDLTEDDDKSKDLATLARFFVYDLDGPLLNVQALLGDGKERIERSEILEMPWAITDDQRLNLKNADIWWRYIPASIDDLDDAGFSRSIIGSLMADFREEGLQVIEKFDETKARQFIKEARAKEEAEN